MAVFQHHVGGMMPKRGLYFCVKKNINKKQIDGPYVEIKQIHSNHAILSCFAISERAGPKEGIPSKLVSRQLLPEPNQPVLGRPNGCAQLAMLRG